LRRAGLRLPGLELSEADSSRIAFHVVRASLSAALALRSWWALTFAVPLALVGYLAFGRRAVEFPLGMKTVGELAVYATNFREHRQSGHRWTKNEVSMKVRMTIAEAVGLSLDAVRAETTFAELEASC
jgi:hypothetical protein